MEALAKVVANVVFKVSLQSQTRQFTNESLADVEPIQIFLPDATATPFVVSTPMADTEEQPRTGSDEPSILEDSPERIDGRVIAGIVVAVVVVLVISALIVWLLWQRSRPYRPFVPARTLSDRSSFVLLREYMTGRIGSGIDSDKGVIDAQRADAGDKGNRAYVAASIELDAARDQHYIESDVRRSENGYGRIEDTTVRMSRSSANSLEAEELVARPARAVLQDESLVDRLSSGGWEDVERDVGNESHDYVIGFGTSGSFRSWMDRNIRDGRYESREDCEVESRGTEDPPLLTPYDGRVVGSVSMPPSGMHIGTPPQ